ncbi:MAG: TIM barrel protein [Pseudomonadota bacterium]
MKLAANLSSLWTELPYFDRFEAASLAGFQGVAVPLPYEMPAKETQRAALRAGLPVIQISAPPPNYTGGQRGFAAVPGLEHRFRYDLRRALRYCQALNVPSLHIMAGVAEGPAARATLISNLMHAVETVPEGIMLTLQPQAQQGAYLNSYNRAADIIEAVDPDRVGLQFHSFHAQTLHGDASATFATYASIIRHVQLSDAPHNSSPGSGRINFDRLYDTVRNCSYAGWLVADYHANGPTGESLNWLPMADA